MRREIRFTIPPERAGAAVLDFLTQRFAYHDREGWRQRLGSGRVTVNACPVDPDRRLAAGDVLAYEAADLPEPPMDEAIALVHRDEDVILVNKSGNLTCHPGGRYFNHTLWALLKTRHGIQEPTFINRIDRETSGLVVVAGAPAATKNLRKQFAGRTVTKRYLALVEGLFPSAICAAGWIDADYTGEVLKQRRFVPVAVSHAAPEPHAYAPPEEAVAPSDEAQWAETEFRRLEVHGPVTLIEAVPHTGRLHQIRATLLQLGFPVVGDKLYGTDPGCFLRFCRDTLTPEDRRRLRMRRQALHAAGLRFRHPRDGREMVFEVPLPPDMAAVIRDTGAAR